MLTLKENVFARIIAIVISTFIIIAVLYFFLSTIIAGILFTNQLVGSLPDDAQLIMKESVAARLQGTGDGVEFLSVCLFESDAKIDELESHFDSYNYDYAKPLQKLLSDDMSQEVRFQIEKVEYLPVETMFSHDSRDILFFENVKTSLKNTYYVAIYDGTYMF